ncbi:MAG TPA: cytochrome c-type biogenesis protein CcmH [Candidatus Binatia bacterium]|nr:cytochrome c-type biogenesis protein CcmH [Candidatus Binatia bacterium]
MVHCLLIALFLLVAPTVFGANAPDIEEQTRAIANELRCVVCQNLSVADSPSEMAQQMRAIVREQLEAGKTPQEVKDYFVSKYGEWVLLKPTTQGFSLLVWTVPFAALIMGLSLGMFLIRRWTAKKPGPERVAVDSTLLARVRQEAAQDDVLVIDLEDSSQRSRLLRERARLYSDLKDLDFDFQADKLSAADLTELRRDLEFKAAAVLEQLDRLPADASEKKAKTIRAVMQSSGGVNDKRGFRRWQLAAGAALLLIFGVTLGVVLTNSLRPRVSEGDSITGDFLTGTSAGSEIQSSLNAGKTAFAQQDWPKAIETFKKVLAMDPNQPDAHAYMGFILVQAGHTDGALMAFDKALAGAPNFPMALWGKGMTLYQAKKDFAGARQTLEKLAGLLPPGQERSEVEKALAEMSQTGVQSPESATGAAAATSSAQQISGKITIDAKLKGSVDQNAALFIIARAADTPGPPLAVKKIDRPAFPLSYSLGPENVMIQGTPFSGKVLVSVRLDKDGNPLTREAGDLTGDYKKNPVEVGSRNVDLVLDQLAK